MSKNGRPFASWAVVELMGHQQIAGYVTEEEIAGSALLRVDVPAVQLGDLERPEATKYFGASAIYAIHPCTEELARQAAARLDSHRSPLPVSVPDLSKAEDTIRRAQDASRWLSDREAKVRGRLAGVAQEAIAEGVAELDGRFEQGEAQYEVDDGDDQQ